jgi:hypothetical protein
MEAELNPLQERILADIRLPDDWQPLPEDLVPALESELAEALSPLEGWFTADAQLRVTKHMLATVHGCEAHFLAQHAEPFSWNINTVRGTIAHKGIEILLNMPSPPSPGELADAAMQSVAENPRESAADFINGLSPADRAELRSAVVVYLTTYTECFPPLKQAWRPVVEYPVTYSLFANSVVLSARMDLVIGQLGRKVILDVKTGRTLSIHREDLRFYALVEALRSRRPPRLTGTYSLESARLESEPVSEGMLRAAVRRTAHGAIAVAELLKKKRAPEVRAGAQCRWCPLAAECATGTEYLRRLADPDDDA